MIDTKRRIKCATCGGLMPDHGHASCFTCEFGKPASVSSAKAREAIEAHAKRGKLEVVR